jgi:hypothetical protein
MDLGVGGTRVQRVDSESIKRVHCISLTVFECELRSVAGLVPKQDIVWRVMIMMPPMIGS